MKILKIQENKFGTLILKFEVRVLDCFAIAIIFPFKRLRGPIRRI
jgi:hypothetical protein